MADGLERLRDDWEKATVEERVAFLKEIYRRSAEGGGALEVQALVGLKSLGRIDI